MSDYVTREDLRRVIEEWSARNDELYAPLAVAQAEEEPEEEPVTTVKVVTPDNLEYFKRRQDALNASLYASMQTVASVYRMKGSATTDTLPSNPEVGDAYNLTDRDGMNVVWTGESWDDLGVSLESGRIDEGYIESIFD